MNFRDIPWRYLRNCGLLLLPALAWNLAFHAALPPAFAPSEFWRDIPEILGTLENATRLLVFAIPFFMPLEARSRAQRIGLALFIVGSAIYFSAWLPLMLAPASAWSTSPWGFAAPAYTPAIWLLGIGMLGQRTFLCSACHRPLYFSAVIVFIATHVAHTLLVFHRIS